MRERDGVEGGRPPMGDRGRKRVWVGGYKNELGFPLSLYIVWVDIG